MEEKDNLELERQRIELERQKLELERSKLEFEKEKKSTNSNLDISIIKRVKSPNIIGIALSVITLISLFLPWIDGRGIGVSVLDDMFVKVIGPYGYFFVLSSLAMGYCSFIRFKFSFIIGVLNIVVALIPLINIIDKMGSMSRFIEGGAGLIVFFISSLAYGLLTLVDVKERKVKTSHIDDKNNEENLVNPVNYSKLIKDYKIELLLFIALIFVFIPALTGFNYPISFASFFIKLLFFASIPLLIFRTLKMDKNYKLFFVVPVFISLKYLFLLLSKISDDFTFSNFARNYNESIENTDTWFGIFFYLLIAFTIGVEYCLIKGIKVSDKILPKFNWLFHPVLSFLILLLPFISSLTYYTLSRHEITPEDYSEFNTKNSYLSGDWFIISEDQTKILVLKIQPVSSSQNEQYSKTLSAKLNYSISEMEGESLGYGSIDTIVNYDQKIELPWEFKDGLDILSLNKDVLEVRIKYSNGSNYKTKAYKSPDKFLNIVQKNENLILLNSMIGTYSGDFGDNEIMMKIDEINPKTLKVSGSNSVAGVSRPLKGTVEILDDVCFFKLNEPGDNEYDGVFEFKIYKNSNQSLDGVWRSNTGDLQREFRLYRQ